MISQILLQYSAWVPDALPGSALRYSDVVRSSMSVTSGDGANMLLFFTVICFYRV